MKMKMKINNNNRNTYFTGIMQYETHIIPTSAWKKLRKDPKLEEWMLRKDYYKTFETSAEEDELFISAADETFGNIDFTTLNKHTSKKIFKVLEQIAHKRNLRIFDSHIAMPSIKLTKTKEGYIYDDLPF